MLYLSGAMGEINADRGKRIPSSQCCGWQGTSGQQPAGDGIGAQLNHGHKKKREKPTSVDKSERNRIWIFYKLNMHW